MITCDAFHERFVPGTDDVEVLEHLRTCDGCLDMAAHVDPDVMFRAIGGDMIPPGGIEAFTEDVMRQIQVRGTEHKLAPVRVLSWPRRLAVAAVFAAGFTGTLFIAQRETLSPVRTVAPVQISAAIVPVKLTTKPIVESYDSANATIVEVPTDGADDTRIVMVFDENLPADL
jgi:hypothetical protein